MATSLLLPSVGRFTLSLHRFTQYLILAVIVVALLVLLGWGLEIRSLQSGWPGLNTMKPNTAFGLVLTCVALWLLTNDEAGWGQQQLARGCAMLVALIGALTLGEYFFATDLGIDQLLFREEPHPVMTSHPGRMGPNTALCLVFTGGALLLLNVQTRWLVQLAQGLTLAVLLMALAALLGHAYGAIYLLRISFATQMALHTALAFLALSIALLTARPHRPLMLLVLSKGAGGVLLRRMWPQVIVLLIVLSWLRLKGEQLGLYETAFGTGLLILVSIVLFSLLIWRTAQQVEWLDVERRAAENAEHELDARLHVTLRSIGDAVISTDAAGCINFMNVVAETLTGWTQADAVGRPLSDVFRLVNEQTQASVESPIEQVFRDGTVVGLAHPTLLLTKDGREIPIDDSLAPIRDEHGTIVGAVLVFRDITEHNHAKTAQARLAAIVESSDDAIVSKDLNGRITSWNRGAEHLFGYTAEEMIGASITKIIPPHRLEEETRVLATIRRGEKIDHYETVRQHKDGHLLEISLTVSPLRNAAGVIIGASKIARNITERKQAEEAQRKSEEEFRQLANAVPLLVWVAAADGRMEYVNEQGIEFSGLQVEDASDPQKLVALVHPDDRQQIFGEWLQAAATGTPYQVEGRMRNHRTGEYRWFLTRGEPSKDANGKVVRWFGTSTDITLNKETEIRLRESEERFSKAFKASPMALTISCLTTGKLIEVNETFVRATGYTREEALGKTTLELGLWKRPPDRTAEMEAVRQQGQVSNVEYTFCTKTGEEIIGLLSAERIEIGGQPFGLTVIQDITERKLVEAERERQFAREQELRRIAEQASRLKDEFLATVSHELRTPLNHMLGWAVLLRAGRLTGAKAVEAMETIERNIRAQHRLVEDLLDVSRIISGKMQLHLQPIIPAQVIDAAVASARPAAEAKGIHLDVRLDPRPSPISGDADRLQQVVWNLLSNAIKFTPPGGRVLVQLERHATQLEITVCDTGEGIASEFLPYVFDRFSQADSTTKRIHGGLGLGLAIVRHLVELHGGEIKVESPGVGQGTTFTLRLPLTAGRRVVQESVAAPIHRETAFGQETMLRLDGVRVLVVDDELDSRQLIASMLTGLGTEVRMAGDQQEAIQTLSRWRPDVLISDIGMPNGDGYDLIRAVRQRDASTGQCLPAIALTSYTRTEDRLRALHAGYQIHLGKPVELQELLMVVARLAGRLPPG